MKNEEILFIGDSITEAFDEKRYLPQLKVLNKGVSGDSTVETLERINESWFSSDPFLVFVCIGTNDFARDRSDEFILNNIVRIIEKIQMYSPDSQIVPVSIFPTRDNLPRPNERINQFNISLEKLTFSYNLKFFNINELFIDDNGKLKEEFTEDGLHLTPAAYELWAALVSEFVKDMVE